MPTVKEVEWLDSQPKRTKVSAFPEKSDPTIDEVIRAEKEGMKLQALRRGLGGSEDNRRGDTESLANTIVTKAMEDRSKLVEQMNDDAIRLRNEILQAQKLGQDNQNAFLQTSLDRIKDREERLEEARAAAAAGGAGPDKFESYKEVKTLLQGFIEEMGLKPAAAGPPPVSDLAMQLKLAEMQNNFTLKLHELQQQQKDADRKWDLEMLKWKEEFALKKEIATDGKKFNEHIFEELTDLAHSVADSVTHEREAIDTGNVSSGAVDRVKGNATATTVIPEVQGFPCAKCGVTVPVPDNYPDSVTCPGENCGMTFRLKKTEQPAGVK